MHTLMQMQNKCSTHYPCALAQQVIVCRYKMRKIRFFCKQKLLVATLSRRWVGYFALFGYCEEGAEPITWSVNLETVTLVTVLGLGIIGIRTWGPVWAGPCQPSVWRIGACLVICKPLQRVVAICGCCFVIVNWFFPLLSCLLENSSTGLSWRQILFILAPGNEKSLKDAQKHPVSSAVLWLFPARRCSGSLVTDIPFYFFPPLTTLCIIFRIGLLKDSANNWCGGMKQTWGLRQVLWWVSHVGQFMNRFCDTQPAAKYQDESRKCNNFKCSGDLEKVTLNVEGAHPAACLADSQMGAFMETDLWSMRPRFMPQPCCAF